jgi:hypothetical protein
VISGFNSDIEFQGTIYHVQTEDKGLATPIILSLVYSRGEILASKRSPYEDLIAAGFDEDELNDRLQRQHKLIIAAIRAGRIDDLKRMSMKESEKRRSAKREGVLDIPLVDDSPAPQLPQAPEPPQPVLEEAPAEKVSVEEAPFVPEEAPQEAPKPEPEPAGVSINLPPAIPAAKDVAPIPRPPDDLVIEIPIDVVEEPFFEDVEILEYGDPEETILPAEAVKIITDHVGATAEDDDRLKIRLLGRTSFFSGEEATLDILVARGGKLGRGLSKAHIVIKVLGTAFRPQIFHAMADDNGISQVHIQIPEFKSGRSAILIKAIHEGEEIELRHVIARR